MTRSELAAGTQLVLVRHGHYAQRAATPSALQPFALTPRGEDDARRGAQALAKALHSQGGAELTLQLHCSVLLRAWQTAKLYAEELQTPPAQETPALCERSVGSVANLSITEIEDALANDPRHAQPPKGWKSRSDYRLPFPGAESLNEAGARVAHYIAEVCSRVDRSTLPVFIGHGAALRHAARDLGLLSATPPEKLSMFYGEALWFEREAECWRLRAGRWKLRDASPVD